MPALIPNITAITVEAKEMLCYQLSGFSADALCVL